MEQATTLRFDDAILGSDEATDARSSNRFGDRDKVLRLALTRRAKPIETDRKPSPSDLATTLDIVQRASEAMRLNEERTQALETRMRSLIERATEELNTAEARVKAAEARAKEAEARAEFAEDWLTRISDAIVEQFGPQDRTGSAAAA